MTIPKHLSLTIEHNPHKTVYQSALQWFQDRESLDPDPDYSEETKKQCIAQDSIWTIQYYPDTPIGFHFAVAPNLEELFEQIS